MTEQSLNNKLDAYMRSCNQDKHREIFADIKDIIRQHTAAQGDFKKQVSDYLSRQLVEGRIDCISICIDDMAEAIAAMGDAGSLTLERSDVVKDSGTTSPTQVDSLIDRDWLAQKFWLRVGDIDEDRAYKIADIAIEAMGNVQTMNTSPEHVQKTPENEHVTASEIRLNADEMVINEITDQIILAVLTGVNKGDLKADIKRWIKLYLATREPVSLEQRPVTEDDIAHLRSLGMDKPKEQPDERTEHELAMELIAHDHTKAKLKATEEAYEALLNAPMRESVSLARENVEDVIAYVKRKRNKASVSSGCLAEMSRRWVRDWDAVIEYLEKALPQIEAESSNSAKSNDEVTK